MFIPNNSLSFYFSASEHASNTVPTCSTTVAHERLCTRLIIHQPLGCPTNDCLVQKQNLFIRLMIKQLKHGIALDITLNRRNAGVAETFIFNKQVNRKVQGMQQSQIAAIPRRRNEENKDEQTCGKQTNEPETRRPAPYISSEVIKLLN